MTEPAQGPGPLRLLAEDEEDLAVIAAAVQDAVVQVGDIAFEPAERRLTIAFNRFCWETGKSERVRAGLQLGDVKSVQARRLRRDTPEAVVCLLHVEFEPAEAPGGVVIFHFSGDADLRAEVECLDAVLADVSEPWPAVRAPDHQDS